MKFQPHPYHLVEPSPWPLTGSIALLITTVSAVCYFHGYGHGGVFLTIGLLCVLSTMGLWWADVIREGRALSLFFCGILSKYTLNTSKTISPEEIKQTLIDFSKENANLRKVYPNNDQFGYYLAGLLEGDGHISLPAVGNTTLKRILNPRIVFTSHINNLGLYAFIQSELGGIGRFQITGTNNLRYIIGDKKGILLFINLIHGKLHTPKNKRFNELIEFLNMKYSLNITESLLDTSDFKNNSWFTGFTEADGHFGIKIVESKPKSETRKRSVSENISLKFRLDQRLFDKPNSSFMIPVMEKLASFLSCKLNTYTTNTKSKPNEVLSLSVTGINKLEIIVNYFNQYPLLGVKGKDFKYWEIVYHLILSKEHLTDAGRLKIRTIAFEMKSYK